MAFTGIRFESAADEAARLAEMSYLSDWWDLRLQVEQDATGVQTWTAAVAGTELSFTTDHPIKSLALLLESIKAPSLTPAHLEAIRKELTAPKEDTNA